MEETGMRVLVSFFVYSNLQQGVKGKICSQKGELEPEQVRNIMDSMIRKLYDMELEEQGRSDWQDEKLLSEVRKLLEKNKASIQVEDKTGREGVDLAFAIAEIGEEIGFTQGFKCAFQLFMECRREQVQMVQDINDKAMRGEYAQ